MTKQRLSFWIRCGWRVSATLLLFVAVINSAGAQTKASVQEAIDKALLAAPAELREGAAVIRWKSDFSYETLKKGTNSLVCVDLSGRPEELPFIVICTGVGNMDRMIQNQHLEASGDVNKTKALVEAAEKNGTRVKPEYGSVIYHFMGPDREHARTRIVVALPGATTQSTGLPEHADQSGRAWIVNPGTTNACLKLDGP